MPMKFRGWRMAVGCCALIGISSAMVVNHITQHPVLANDMHSTPNSASKVGVANTVTMTTPPGVTDAGTNALTSSQIKQQNQITADLMNEQALAPKVLKDGTKQYTLTATPIVWNLYLKKNVNAWGYNGQVSGPLLRFKVGDHVQIVLKNKLPVATSLHLQGVSLPSSQDGISSIAGVSHPAVAPGQSRTYTFTVTKDMVGTHAYFSGTNIDNQIDKGLHGPIIVDPAVGKEYPDENVDALFDIGSYKVDASASENVFALNGKPFPNAPVLPIQLGDHVIVRLVNSSAEDYHAMHLHGYTFEQVSEDGHHLAKPIPMNVLTMAPEETADFEFIANNPGNWMFHCHILDHTINPDDDVDSMQGLMTYFDVTSSK